MFDPYHKWLGIPKDQRPPTYYQLLGIGFGESDKEVIEEAIIRQTTYLRGYQTGPHAADCTRLLNEIAHAGTVLLNPAKRQEYHAKLAASKPAAAHAIRAPAAITAAVPTALPTAVPAALPVSPIADAFADLDRPTPVAHGVEPPDGWRGRDDAGAPNRQALYWGLGLGAAALVLGVILLVLLLNRGSERNTGNPSAKDGPRLDRKLDGKLDGRRDGEPRRDNIEPKRDDFKGDVKKDGDIDIEPRVAKAGPEWDNVDLTFATVMDGFVRINSEPTIALGADPKRRIVTRRTYSGPIEIEVVARTAHENIRIHAGRGGMLIFNWEAFKDLRTFLVHRPDAPTNKFGSGSHAMVKMEPLAPDTWYTLRWRITEEGMEIAVDDRIIFEEKRTLDLSPAEPVGVCAMRSPVDVKSFVVRELPRLAKKENPPPFLPGDTPLDQLDAAKVPPEDRYPPFGNHLVAVLKGHTGEIFAVAFAPNGKLLASTGNDGKVFVWDPLQAEPGRLVYDGKAPLAGLAFSPDSARLAVGTREDILLWDVGKWDEPSVRIPVTPVRTIPGEMAWSADGKHLAIGRKGLIVLLHMARPGPNAYTIVDRDTTEHCRLSFTSDGSVLAIAGGDGVRVWDIRLIPPRSMRSVAMRAPAQPKGMAIHPDGRKLALTAADTSMRLRDLTTNADIDIPAPRKQHTFDSSAAFSPDGKTVLTTGLDHNGRPQATWRSGEDFSLIREWPLPERSSQVAFDATGRYAAFTSHNKKLYLVRLPPATALPKRPQPPVLPGAGDGAHFRTEVRGSVHLLADQRQALVGGVGLAIVDVGSGQTVSTLQAPSKVIGSGGEVSVATASPRALSAATHDNVAYVWDLQSQEQKHVLKGHEGLILTVAISPDGKRGLTGSGGIKIIGKEVTPREASLRLWDLDNGTEIGKYEAHGGDIHTAVFVGDGLKALTGGRDGTVCLWDFSQTTPLVKTIKAHSAPVHALAFAPKARRFITAGADKKVRLWDLDKLSELYAFDVAVAARHAAIDHAARFFAVSVNKQIEVYDLNPCKQIAGFALPTTARGLAMAADGRFVVATNLSGTLSVWQVPMAPASP